MYSCLLVSIIHFCYSVLRFLIKKYAKTVRQLVFCHQHSQTAGDGKCEVAQYAASTSNHTTEYSYAKETCVWYSFHTNYFTSFRNSDIIQVLMKSRTDKLLISTLSINYQVWWCSCYASFRLFKFWQSLAVQMCECGVRPLCMRVLTVLFCDI